MKFSLRLLLRNLLLLFSTFAFGGMSPLLAQSLDVSTCPVIDKRNNGNGQYAESAGYFPGYGQHNPSASNVEGTTYDTVNYDPATKTGYVNFYWSSATTITNLPVITRVWLADKFPNSPGIASDIRFGPPPPPSIAGQRYYVKYSFYVSNMPPAGKVTLEFADPRTGIPAFRCTYNLQSGEPETEPQLGCTPYISSHPSNRSLCGSSSTTFTVVASGASSYQWQVSSDGSSFSNISNGGNYSGVTTDTLTISTPDTYDGKYYRCVITGATGCGSTTSSMALLVSKPIPTAVFPASSYCGTGNRALQVNLTGTAPWSITYTTNGGSSATISNILASPFFFTVNPSTTTTYAITSVNDAYCTNSSPTGTTSTTINPKPSITPTNATACYSASASSFNLSFSSSGSPDKYSLFAGTRAMSGFSTITNSNLGSSPLNISVPAGTAVGTYDFKILVRNNSSSCVADTASFTFTVNANPVLSASATSGIVCAGSTVSLTAAPTGLTSYTWQASPSATIADGSSTSATITTSATTYTVTGTNSNGCSATANVTVNPTSGPTLAVSPSAPTICRGNTVFLTASGGNTYSWTPSATLSGDSGATIAAAPTSSTTYTVTSKNSSGCASVGTVTVTVETTTMSISATSSTLCQGNSTTLTASGGSTYVWSPSSSLSASTGTSVTATPGSSTTYSIVGTTANGCIDTASTTITITAAPVDYANSTVTSSSNNFFFCTQQDNNFTLKLATSSSVTSGQWSYSTDSINYTNYTSIATSTVSGINTATTSITGTLGQTTINLPNGNSQYSGPRYFRYGYTYNGCNFIQQFKLFDTKITAQIPEISATSSNICSGSTTTLSIGSATTTLTGSVQWQSATSSGGTYSNVSGGSGATSMTYTTGALTATTYYKTVFNPSGTSCDATTNEFVVTVNPSSITNTVTPSTQCTNGTSSDTLSGNAVSGATYSWKKSISSASSGFNSILGASNQYYRIPGNIVATKTWYKRTVANGCATDSSAIVEAYAPIANNQISNSPTSFCTTSSATALTGTLPTGGDGTYVYAWESSTTSESSGFSTIGGATSINYTTTPTSSTTWYIRKVTSGGCTSYSPSIKFTIYSVPTINATSGSTICNGVSVSLTASGASSYSWSPSTGLSATTGATVIATPSSTTTYTITGTDTNNCSNTTTTTLTVNAAIATPTLSSSSSTICNNSSVNLTSLVTSGGTTEWYTAPEANASYLLSSATAVSTSGTYYVFGKSGSCYSAAPDTFTLTVINVSTPSVGATSFNGCSPSTIDLTALHPDSNAGASFSWHTVSSGPSGANQVSTPTAVSTGTYYLYRYSSAGSCYGSASSAVSVTINTPPSVTLSSSSESVCEPSTIDLTAKIQSPDLVNNAYRWYTSNSSPTPANLVLIPASISSSNTYYAYATSTAGCTGSASSGFTATFNTKPVTTISNPPSVCGGTAITITGTSTPAGSSYAWRFSTNAGSTFSSLSNGGVYSGATTLSLGISSSSGLGGNQYQFISTTSNGCKDTSSSAIVSEETTPSIETDPTNQSVYQNTTALFTAETGGSPTGEIKWQVSDTQNGTYTDLTEGSPYAGVKTGALVITASLSLNNKYYRCIVYNSCGSDTSTGAKLTVANCTLSSPPTFTAQPGATACTNTNVTYTTQSGQTSYTWDILGADSVDYYLISGGTSSDNSLTVKWITTGSKTVTINYVDGSGCTNSTAVSSTATTVSTSPEGGTVSGTQDTICSGGSVTYTVSGHTGTIQWQSSTSSATSGFSNIGGATSTTYAATSITTKTYYRAMLTNGSCGTDSSNVDSVTVFATSVGGSVSGAADTVCTSSNSTVLTLSGHTGNIQWQSSTSSATSGFSDIASATSSTYTATNITAKTYYRAVVTSGVCSSANSSVDSITVSSASVGGSVSGAADTVCTSSNSTVLTLSGHTGTIQWQSSTSSATSGFSDISSATSSTYTATNISAKTYYRAVVTSGVCSSANSSVDSITVSSASVGGSVSGAADTVCSSSNSTVLTLSGHTGTIQWQSSTSSATGGFSDISSATSSTYTATNISAKTYYRAVVTSGVCSSANSSVDSITVSSASVGGSVSGAADTVCTSSNSTVLTLSGHTGTIQWQSSTSSATSGFSDISSATSSTYTATNISAKTYYRTVVTSGVCSSANSSVDSITVSSASVGGSVSGAADTVCTSSNSTVLTLSGHTGTIQWQSSTSSATSGFSDISSATSSTYTATNITAKTYYRAVVTSGVCSSANSSVDSITVSSASVGGSVSGAADTVCSSSNSTVLTLSGHTGNIQWQSSTSSASDGFSNIASATSSTYTATNITAKTYYRAVVTSGVCSSANSSVDSITVSSASVGGSVSGAADTVCASSNSTVLTLSGHTGTIQWQSSTSSATGGFSDISSATSSTYTANNISAKTYYRAVVTSGVCSSANSSVDSITVSSASVGGSVSGAADTVCTSSNSTVLTLSGHTGNIQWQSSTSSATSGFSDISSATSSTYTATNISAKTYYRAVVTSGVCSSANSSVDSIITTSPILSNSISGNTRICYGSTAGTLSGSTPTGGNGSSYTYLWIKSTTSSTTGFNTANGTNNSKDYSPGTLTTNSWFKRIVTSGVCSADTSSALLDTVSLKIAYANAATPINMTYGTSLSLPTTITVKYVDSTSESRPVTWDSSGYSGSVGTYNYTGSISLASGTCNTGNVTASITITVNQKAITVKADAKSKIYGASDPSLTYAITVGSLVGSDAFTGSLSRTTGENVGKYSINQGTLALSSNYTLTYQNDSLTISTKAITVKADAKSKTYGDSDPSLTYAITVGSLGGSDAFTGSLSRTSGENVGKYSINQGTLALSSNYTLTYQNDSLTISTKAITVKADAKSKTYGDSDPSLTYTITSGTLVGSDAFSGSLSRTSGENVGKYSINQGTLALSNNYTLTYQNDSLTISTKAITVKADAKSKTYGDSDPSLTYTITSGALVGSDAFSGSLSRTTGENVGKYSINQGTLALSSNYTLTYQNDSLTISTKAITVKADAKSKTYGDSDPSLTYAITVGSLVGSDAFTGSLSRTNGENVGKYSINQGTLALSSNYSLTYQNDSLTISTKAITVKADAKSKTYGASDPSLTYAITVGSLVGSDAFTGSLSRTSGENVGKYSINQGTLALSSNYSLTYQNDSLTISTKTITVKADAKSKTYGDSDPSLTYSLVSGTLVGSDAFTGSLTRTSGENVGKYSINQGTLALSSNYTLTYQNDSLTISTKAITVKADAKSKTYGASDPSLTYTITSGTLVGSDAFTGSLSRTSGENVGKYSINQGTLALSSNYTLTYQNDSLTISTKAITVKADAKSKTYGDSDPSLTYSLVSGTLVGSDAFTGSLTRTSGENVGKYSINQGTLALSNNYTLTYQNDSLTISTKAITVKADAKSKTYGDSDPSLTYTITSGTLVGSDAFSGSLSRTSGENVGKYSINQGTLALSSNYTLTYQNDSLTIFTKAITVKADAKSKTYGDSDPSLTYAITVGSLVGSDAFTGSLSRTTGENVGKYSINQGTLALSSNYTLTYQNDSLTIFTKAITVKADAKSKTYGDSDPSLTYAITVGSLVGSDAFTGSLSRTTGENVGKYSINQGTLALSSNYTLTYQNDSLTISTKAITVKADAKSKTYGASDPSLTYSLVSGTLVGSDAFTGSLTRTSGENVGKYSINQGTLALSSNYTLTYQNDSLTISTRAITVKADAKSKIYGASDPSLTYAITVGSLVGSDAFTGSLSRTSGENVGKYSINQGTLALSSNYTLTYQNDSLTISTKAITVKADAKSKTYGDSDPLLTYTITSGTLVGSDAFSGSLSRTTGENVGKYSINQGTLALSSNYTLTYQNDSLTISTKAITVKADAKSKTYGDSDPSLTYTITSGTLVGSDAFTGSLSRTTGENVGKYSINQGTLALSSNYTLTYQNDSLTIFTKAITVKADAKSKTYGDSDPSLTYAITVGSLVGSDAFSGSLSRTTGENVGKYSINQGTLALSSNYSLTYQNDSLTISTKAITVKADAKSKTYGDSDPSLTYSLVSGTLVGSDAFTGSLSRTSGENVGKYSINQGTLALSSNYTLTYQNDSLTITPKLISVKANDANKPYGTTKLFATDGSTVSVAAGTLNSGHAIANAIVSSAGSTPSAAIGQYNIDIVNGSLIIKDASNTNVTTNYSITLISGILTVNGRIISLSVSKNSDSTSITAGDSIPYTITITNNGIDTIHNGEVITILDQPQTGLTIGTYQTSAGIYSSSNGKLTLNNLFAPSQSIQLKIKAHVAADYTAGSITNTVQIKLPDDVTNTGDSISTNITPVKRWIDLSISKTTDSLNITAGDTITYSIQVNNNGLSTLLTGEKVTILEQPAAGLTVLNYSTSNGTYNSINGALTLNNAFAKGQSITLLVKAKVAATYTGSSIKNIVLVRLPIGITLHGDSIAEVTTPVRRWSALTVIKTTDSLSITAGDTITYSIKVKNVGPSALIAGEVIKIIEQPAAGLIIDAYTTSNGNYNPASGNLILNTNFLQGNQIELRVKAHVIAEYTGTSIINTVLVRLPVGITLHGDSTSSVTTPVKRWIDLTVDKSSDSNAITAGDSITYTLTIKNNGVSSLVTGEKITVMEQPESGLDLGSITSMNGLFNSSTGQLTLANTFAKGQTITLSVSARVTPTYSADSINNFFIVRLPDDVKLHGDSTGSKKVRVRSLINAVLDDYSNIPVDGAKGGLISSVLWNDSVNNIPAVPNSSLQISLLNNDGMTGVSLDSSGQIHIPAGTWEGMYYLTYRLCDTTNCDTATAIVRITRGLQISVVSKCVSDVPYIHYKVTPNFTPDSLNPVSIQWLNGDGTPLSILPASTGLPLEADILYAGTKPDLSGNPTSWPGWCFDNGVWRPCDDGFLGVRPKARLVIGVNPTDTIEVNYPPATPNCNALPPAITSMTLSKRLLSAGPFVNVNDSVIYEIMVRNTGNVDLHQIEITDSNAAWLLPSNGMLDTLKYGDSAILKAWHRITLADMNNHLVSNYASATAKDTGNTIITIYSDTVSTPVERTVNLRIVKSSESITRYAGDSLAYTIKIINNGNSRIDSGETITVVDQPGIGLSIGNIVTSDGNYQQASGVLTLTRNWNKQDSLALFVKGRIDPNFTLDTIRNAVTVNLPIDIKQTGDSVANNVRFVPRPLIGLAKRATAPVLQSDSTYDIGFVIFVRNYGNVELKGIQVLDDLKKTIPSPSTFTVKSSPVASGALTSSATYNGNTMLQLLDSTNSTLSPGSTATISFLINVNPKGNFGPFNNLAFGTAYDTLGGYRTSDTSTAGNNPDPLGTGNPRDSINNEPTEFSFIPIPVIGIAKSVSVPEVSQDGDQVVTYTLHIKNYSVMPLKNVQISDNLMKTFPSPTTFTVIGTILSGNTIQANNSFNGSSDTSLLVASLSNLAPYATDSISFRIRINPNGKYGPFINTAYAFGIDSTGTQMATDASTNGFNPDPNADSKPKENEPTILLLTEPKIPVKVPTGFSPNGDGLNDYYYIDNPKGYRLYFAVYNRWGNLIFEKENYDNSWDGGAKKGIVIGNKIPDGTYFYILEFTDEFGVTHRSSKFLTISR